MTQWQPPDVLSPAARAVLAVNRASAYTTLVAHSPASARPLLEELTPDQLLTTPVRSNDDARALLAGLWLWHDFLDDSHKLSQSIATPTGSFWHAIMHRREGDFSNARYWYARCRRHPALDRIPPLARAALGPSAAATAPFHRLTDEGWDPGAFTDAVEALHRTPDDPLYATAVQLQQLEWQALFDHTARAAAGVAAPHGTR